MKRISLTTVSLILSHTFLLLICVVMYSDSMSRFIQLRGMCSEIHLIAEFNHNYLAESWDNYVWQLEKFASENRTVQKGFYLQFCQEYLSHSVDVLDLENVE